jgi:hypothetical protein
MMDTAEAVAAIVAGGVAIAAIANASLIVEVGLKIWKKLRRAA